MTENGAGAPPPAHPRTVTIGDRELLVERVSARKASRAFAILRGVGNRLEPIAATYGEARAEYERTHYSELDRAQAMRRYGGPSPVVQDGELVRDEAGNVVTLPSGLAGMSDADWEQTGNRLRVPDVAPDVYLWAAVFDKAVELAEEHVYRLLALFTIPNEEVKRHRREGTIADREAEVVDEVLDDAYADELLELAVVCGEVIDEQFRNKVAELGSSRLGNALRLLGIDPAKFRRQTPQEPTQTASSEEGSTPTPTTSPAQPSSSRPASSGDGPESSDGPPTKPSTPRSSSSSHLAAVPSSSDDG